MLVLGLILLLLAVGLFLGFLASGSEQVTFDGGVLDVTMSTLAIYLLGALTLLLLVVGLAMLRLGLRRASQRRQERKELNRLSAKVEEHEAEKRLGEEGTDDRSDPAEHTTTTPAATDRPTETSTRASTESGTAPNDGGAHRA